MWLQVLFLAILQGVTEFLPISSSAHMIFAARVMEMAGAEPIQEPLMLGIMFHLASLLAVILYYWRPIWRMFIGKDMRLLSYLIVASIPIWLVGLAVKLWFKDLYENSICGNLKFVGFMWIVTAIFLIIAHKIAVREPGFFRERKWRRNFRNYGYLRVFLVGLMQAVAILPGISRSGATITAGMLTGLKRTDAAKFAFLLAILSIGAAGVSQVWDLLEQGSKSLGNVTWPQLTVGFFLCFVVSMVSLHALIRVLKRRKIGYFAFYLIPMGILLIALGL